MSRIEVVCVGLATADTIVELPRWPEPDGRVVADTILRSGGGPAATAAVTLARLGHSVAMVGSVGNDEIGERVRAGLEAERVDVTHLSTTTGRSAESVILLDRSAETRTILHAPGARLEALDESARAACGAATWVHADHAGFRLVDGTVESARISVDAGHHIESLALDGVGLYAPSESALRHRYPGLDLGHAMWAALDEGALRVVVTLGRAGTAMADRSGAWRAGGLEADVVSTLGAGDVFHGALLASLLDGMTLADAARRANVAAALSCRALDGRRGIPQAAELDAVLAGAPPMEPVMLDRMR